MNSSFRYLVSTAHEAATLIEIIGAPHHMLQGVLVADVLKLHQAFDIPIVIDLAENPLFAKSVTVEHVLRLSCYSTGLLAAISAKSQVYRHAK